MGRYGVENGNTKKFAAFCIIIFTATNILHSQEEKVNVEFANVKSWQENNEQIYFFSGNPEVHFKDTYIKAQYIIGWAPIKKGQKAQDTSSFQLEDVYAEGNAKIKKRDREVFGDAIYYNLKNESGLITNFVSKSVDKNTGVPRIIRAKEAREIAKGHFKLKDASLTTCTYAVPHFYIEVKDMELTIENFANEAEPSSQGTTGHKLPTTFSGRGTNITPSLYGFPLFYFPKWNFSSSDEPILRSLNMGSSTRFGRYAYGTWGFPITNGFLRSEGLYNNPDTSDDNEKWGNFNIITNYRQLRGPEVGENLDFQGGSYVGFLDSYYFNDRGPNTDNSFDKQFLPLQDSNRGRIRAFYRQDNLLIDGLRGEVELSYFSDRNLLKEFYPTEFEEGEEQQTAIYLRYLNENIGATFLENGHLNYFQTQTLYSPQLKFYMFSEPIFENFLDGLYITTKTEVADERRVFDGSFNVPSIGGWRLDTFTDISTQHDFGFLQVYPFIGIRLTDYQQSIGNIGSQARVLDYGGIRLNTQLWRTFDAHSDLFGLNGLKHIMNLEASYITNYNSTAGIAEELFQIDNTDLFNRFSQLAFDIRNSFQTKRDNQIVEFLNIGTGIEYYPHPFETVFPNNTNIFLNTSNIPTPLNSVITPINSSTFTSPFYWIPLLANGNGVFTQRSFSDVFADFIFTPSNYFVIHGKEAIDTQDGTEDMRNIGFTAYPFKDLGLGVSNDASRFVYNAVTFNFSWKLAEKWYVSASEQYDIREKLIHYQGVTIDRDFHDFTMGITIENDTTRGEKQFLLEFIPTFMGQSPEETHKVQNIRY